MKTEFFKDHNGNIYVGVLDYKVRLSDGTCHDGTTVGEFIPIGFF